MKTVFTHNFFSGGIEHMQENQHSSSPSPFSSDISETIPRIPGGFVGDFLWIILHAWFERLHMALSDLFDIDGKRRHQVHGNIRHPCT